MWVQRILSVRVLSEHLSVLVLSPIEPRDSVKKTILVTGSTDGIGLATAERLLLQGHRVLLHGRNAEKLRTLSSDFSERFKAADRIASFTADLSTLAGVQELSTAVHAQESHLDVLINNVGIYKSHPSIGAVGIDLRFMVNTLAPWLLTQALKNLFSEHARVINLSSAAQEAVDLEALVGKKTIEDDFSAYAQSKLALTAWSMEPEAMGLTTKQTMVAVNPGSLLASKMVREGFGTPGKDIGIGAEILHRFAVEPTVKSGCYFDNDVGDYAAPHPWAQVPINRNRVLTAMAELAS